MRVYDVGELADGRPSLVLTHAAGGSVAGHLEDGGDVDGALTILGQVVEGLQILHSKGIVHRNVNAHDVLLLEPRAPVRRLGSWWPISGWQKTSAWARD